MLIKAQNKMTPAVTLKNKKMAKSSHFPLGGVNVLSNSNIKIYISARWIRVVVNLN